MAKTYHSVVLDHPADDVWTVIRPFDHYAWAGVAGETVIENGKTGDQVGAVRRFTGDGRTIPPDSARPFGRRPVLHYAFCGDPLSDPGYEATIRVTPVTAENRSSVEWWAIFDCAIDEWVAQIEDGGFAKGLAALHQFMGHQQADSGTRR